MLYVLFTLPAEQTAALFRQISRSLRGLEFADKNLPINLKENANFVLHSRNFVL